MDSTFPSPQKKLYMKTYGCQMNVYDSGRMADILSPLGYVLVEQPDAADLIIINTCHIREKAEEKLFSDLGRLRPFKESARTKNKNTILAVAGCVAQAQGDEILRRAPYVDLVFGPQTYHLLPEMIASAARKADGVMAAGAPSAGCGIVVLDFPVEPKFDALPPQETVSGPCAFLSIQEGCDKFCTFCVVPYTRGAEFSRPVQQVLEEAKHLIAKGAKEITLLGQNVNAYHGQSPRGKGDWGLGALIRELATLDGLLRIRYMTSHPKDMDADLIRAHQEVPILMPFLHLPVQSGSNSVLKAMNRKHDRDFYLHLVDQLRHARPDIALSSDFIVGFPGEKEKDFEQTLSLIDDVRFAQAFSFKYSPRPGTPGALREDQIPEAVKDQRLQEIQKRLSAYQLDFNQKMVGKKLPILVEKPGKNENQWVGRSPYMQSVLLNACASSKGEMLEMRITEAFTNSLTGEWTQAA